MLKIKDMNLNNVIRQGDTQPRQYQLDTGNLNLNLTNKSATIRLMTADFQGIGYETTATVSSDNKISFSIDDVIPARQYRLEVTVDDYVFPSRATDGQFNIDPSSHGQEVNIINVIGVDAVVRKAVDLINKDPNLIIDEDKLVSDIISNTGIGNIEEYYQQFNDVITELSEEKDYHSLPEIAGARGGFDTLGDRLNETTAQLAQKVGGGVKAGPEDLSAETLGLVTGEGGPINLLSIPQHRSVTPGKTTFIDISSNLFNKNDLLEGYALDRDTGQPYEFTLCSTTRTPISLQPGKTYTFFSGYTEAPARIAYFDASGDLIKISNIADAVGRLTEEAPENTDHILMHVAINRVNVAQINEGTEVLPYEPFYLELSKGIKVDLPPITNGDLPQIEAGKLEFMETSTNLFNIEDITLGKVINSTGVIVDNQYYGYSHPIHVTPNSELTTYGIYYVAFYDMDDKFISRLGQGLLDTNTLTVPNNAYFARVNFMTQTNAYAQGRIQVNNGDRLLPFEEFGAKIKSQYIPHNTSNGETFNKFIIDTSLEGTFSTDKQFDDYTSNGWITIPSNDVYAMVDSLQAEHPDYITKQELEPDATGLEISAYHLNPQRPQMTNQKRYPTIFIVTGTHGYERSSVINMYHLVKELSEHWKENETIEALRFNVNIIWIPIINPYGWTQPWGAQYQRTNSNGIDIARQFPDDWVEGDPSSSNYGGEAPLTEIEALNVKKIFDENPNIDIFYDYHNFGDVRDEYIWLATASSHSEQLGEALIKKMSRKWSSDFTFIPEGKLVGYTSFMNRGTMHNYAYKTLGIERSGTFETNNQFHLDTESVKYNQDSVKAGLESIVNFLIINLRDLVEH